MPKEAELWNLAEVSEKHRLMRQISTLPAGLYEVLIKPKRKTRSLNQNSYYFAAICTPFRDWLVENWGEKVTVEQAHETLKLALLERSDAGGVELMPATHNLDTAAFSEYVESAIQFLATKCDIAVIPAEVYYETSIER